MTPQTYTVAPCYPVLDAGDLSPMQSGLAACVLDGLDTAEAAAALGVNRRTVEAMLVRMQARTGTSDRAALARRLRELA